MNVNIQLNTNVKRLMLLSFSSLYHDVVQRVKITNLKVKQTTDPPGEKTEKTAVNLLYDVIC